MLQIPFFSSNVKAEQYESELQKIEQCMVDLNKILLLIHHLAKEIKKFCLRQGMDMPNTVK
jgi:hypothetical protein